MDQTPFAIGDVIAEKYRVERVLGEGGMGVVVAATHLQLKRRVALKFLLPGMVARSGADQRFLREARAAASLTSEHSVRIFDFGQLPDGAAYLVMEFLAGLDLAALVEQRGPLSVPLASHYMLEAALGLAEAHARGIVHRDIKPQNLFLCRSASGEAIIKVLDFGVSKVTPAFSGFAETKSGAILGSPMYMAPEQMRSAHAVDARADVWALACTLFKLLTGKEAFAAESLPELCARVLHGEPDTLAQCGDFPPELGAFVARCLAKDPAERPVDLAAFAQGLAPFCDDRGRLLLAKVQGALAGGQPELAATLPAAPPARKETRGRRPVWALAGALAFVGLAALVQRGPAGSKVSGPPTAAASVVPHTAPEVRTSHAAVVAPPAPAVGRAGESTPDGGSPPARSEPGAATAHLVNSPTSARRASVSPQRTSVRTDSVATAASEPKEGGGPSVPEARPSIIAGELEARDPRLMRH